MTVLLDAERISLTRGSRRVLQPVDLRVRAGRSHALLGPNGAGKTTTLGILTGLLPPTTGRVEVDGLDLREPAARALVGYAPDDLPLPAALTGAEYLTLHDRLRRRDDRARAAELCALLGIRDSLARQISEYSHGMRRKLQFVAAVVHDPLVLILDEPYRGLDPRAAAFVRRYLDGFTASGRAVVVATHDLSRAERDSAWVWLIDAGAVVAQGTPDAVRRQAGADDLEAAFAHLTGGAIDHEAEQRLLATLPATTAAREVRP
ncbi:ABC transporter ATP-binding protein [Protaetiibacter mangrovi]|uniref:ABC transporter ATP-binding protein n=1 Tax=Protaetiibacter mangrovi TaxID=2970926 RepID=A0ABT1ZHN6_9MICO|nr:ABC transporter ATP-binding protein [Protaetiibacter mangrovi]MCS0500202.1 ABC transporter ATP-binding protein [Protaetiibacter mangrovi]